MWFSEVIRFDGWLLSLLNKPADPWLNTLAIALYYSVYGFLAFLLAYYYTKRRFLFFWKRRRKKFLQLMLNLVVGCVAIYFIKYLVRRGRPSPEEFSVILNKPDPSFPSTHAFISLLCWRFIPKRWNLPWKVVTRAYLLSIPMVALYLGIHYPSDVIVGAILGIVLPSILSEKRSETLVRSASTRVRMLKESFKKVFC